MSNVITPRSGNSEMKCGCNTPTPKATTEEHSLLLPSFQRVANVLGQVTHLGEQEPGLNGSTNRPITRTALAGSD